MEIKVTSDAIDEYISYRLLLPSYVMYDELSIRQRKISNFEERDIYNNTATGNQNKQCINCHSYQNYKTDNMQFHTRRYNGGTLIVSDGVPKKVNIKNENLISEGVYPAWHPTEKLIAYSVNNTGQRFYSKDLQKVEVLDTESYLVLFDVPENEVTIIRNESNAFETFPAWSPDGKTLYYVSTYFEPVLNIPIKTEVSINYKELKYDIFRLSFEPATKKFGEPELVFHASALNKSATFPRISPDGNYLLFSMGDYGVFHIWHTSSDLVLMDLRTGELDMMEMVNSDNVESYHTWSSNGRWIIFSSRRDDGSYTRLYISNFDREGKWSKPFILPQKDPNIYSRFFKSFNIPEFMVEPVKLSVKDFAKTLKGETIHAIFQGNHTSSAVELNENSVYD
jgi:Tol biopolymer transport system component